MINFINVDDVDMPLYSIVFTEFLLELAAVMQKKIKHYLLGIVESYGPTAQHSQDCQMFIQLNYVHKLKQNNVLPPYVKLPCHKVVPGITLLPSHFSHIA